MRLLYDSALKEINTKLEILNQEFQLIYQYNPIEHVSSRIKSPESIAKKLRHNGRAITAENIIKYINDMAGIRIICSFTSDIYRLAGLIAKQNDITVIKIKDYIKKPKENGYTSYHMIVSVPIFLTDGVVDTKVEIQIRTIAMDFWASLEHKMYYKFEGNAPANIRRELKECADLVAFLDRKMLALNEEIKKASGEDEDDRRNYRQRIRPEYRPPFPAYRPYRKIRRREKRVDGDIDGGGSLKPEAQPGVRNVQYHQRDAPEPTNLLEQLDRPVFPEVIEALSVRRGKYDVRNHYHRNK